MSAGHYAGPLEEFRMRTLNVQHWEIDEHVAARYNVALAGYSGVTML